MFYEGEGSIPKIKRLIHSMTPNFASNAVESFMQTKTISELVTAINIGFDDIRTSLPIQVKRMYLAAKHVMIKESSRNGVTDSNTNVKFMTFGENGFLDCDSLRAKGVSEDDCPLSTNDLVIPILVDKTTSYIYVLEENKRLLTRLIPDTSNCEIVAEALYLRITRSSQFVYPTDEFMRKDLVCGGMFQHPTKKSFYYAITMDWKELVYIDKDLIFALPHVKNEIPEQVTTNNKRKHQTI